MVVQISKTGPLSTFALLVAVKVMVIVPPGVTASLVVVSKKRMVPGSRLGSGDQFTDVPEFEALSETTVIVAWSANGTATSTLARLFVLGAAALLTVSV